jgi:hypothetical protein
MVHLTLSNGEKITATEGHAMRTTEGWRDAILLKKGGKLLLQGEGDDADSSRAATIVDIQTEHVTVPVYNIEVANAHAYFVGEKGALVHNGACKLPKPPRGKGAVPKSQRDKKRYFDSQEREAKRKSQNYECANGCGTKIDKSNSHGHHIDRHADGGKTVPANHAEVCTACHKDLHSK